MKNQTIPRAARAAQIRRQIEAADSIDTTGNWRRRVAKARLLTRLRDQEARLRQASGNGEVLQPAVEPIVVEARVAAATDDQGAI